jgi:spore coat polysaccharide biosynthesis protein SpsF
MTRTVAIIQARMGSTRLPGKVMLPLGDQYVLEHVVDRVKGAEKIDKVIVATSEGLQDDVIHHLCEEKKFNLYRGSESNVQKRFSETLENEKADIIVRVTADCPLISSEFLDYAISCIEKEGADYVAAAVERTFPRGLTAEVFTSESFEQVCEHSNDPRHREHVTPYYRENPEKFEIHNIYSKDVFSEEFMINRTDVRLTLDRAEDYKVLREIYENVDFEDSIDIREAVKYVDENDLSKINGEVETEEVDETSD